MSRRVQRRITRAEMARGTKRKDEMKREGEADYLLTASLALVASSTRYTRPLKWMPLWLLRDISQVLDVEYPSEHPATFKCCRDEPVSTGYLMPRSPAMPQHGMLDGTTSSAHIDATFMNESSMPIFLDEQGTWMATLSLTLLNSSLSSRKCLMNSTGSYSENRSEGSLRPALIWDRQGDVSQTIGYLPFSEARMSAASSSAPFFSAAPLNPRLLNIIPQQDEESPSGYTTS
mmetsp:Transcript_963/g.2882  ORF Transcript_963/g.2882 Transcript_963/m.2882 type:complete len:232 (+) Transcript_963:399-1094(+)